MKQEIATAAVFFSQLLQKDNDASRIAKFTQLLTDALAARYASHWHKDMPHVGSGYRCLRSSHKGLDPVLRRVCLLLSPCRAFFIILHCTTESDYKH